MISFADLSFGKRLDVIGTLEDLTANRVLHQSLKQSPRSECLKSARMIESALHLASYIAGHRRLWPFSRRDAETTGWSCYHVDGVTEDA